MPGLFPQLKVLLEGGTKNAILPLEELPMMSEFTELSYRQLSCHHHINSPVRYSTPFEYSYVSLDDEWTTSKPFLEELVLEKKDNSPRQPRNPLKFAARLARRIRRQD